MNISNRNGSETIKYKLITLIALIFQLLEEMLDNGFPLATELNILTELIKPPTIINKAVSMVTGKEG